MILEILIGNKIILKNNSILGSEHMKCKNKHINKTNTSELSLGTKQKFKATIFILDNTRAL